MKIPSRVVALAATALILTGCAENSLSTRAVTQKLPDGRSVVCVISTTGDTAPSCDWDNAK